jgi:biopolymer transport protein ExbD
MIQHRRKRRARLGESALPSLPMAPMIDIVFQLISFFLFALNFQANNPLVDPPIWKKDAQRITPDREFQVEIDREGRLVDEQGRTQPLDEQAGERLQRLFQSRPADALVVIRADRRTPYVHIGRVLRWCQEQQIQQISLRLRKPE